MSRAPAVRVTAWALAALTLLAVAAPVTRARASAFGGLSCSLTRKAGPLSEGSTNRALFAPSKGALRAAMLFVDFSDAPAGGETTQALGDAFIPAAEAWYAVASRGQLALAITPVD